MTAVADESATLLYAIGAGDVDAFGRFYDRWAEPVHAFVARFIVDAQRAESTVEQIFWRVWSVASGYNPTSGPVVVWLLPICRECTRRSVVRRRHASAEREPTVIRPPWSATADGCLTSPPPAS
ncbi:MAG: hypothetical protein NVS1B4_21740 [Gemmatimonadaceae bacterium]